MSATLERIWHNFLHQLEAVKRSGLSATEETKKSWARAVESFDEVPELYRAALGEIFPDPALFPGAVLTPTYEGFMRRESEKLICCPGPSLLILEKERGGLTQTCYPFAGISYLEFGAILLQAWITLRGFTGGGELATTTLKFNTVTDYLFFPILNRIRAGRPGLEGTLPREAAARFEALGERSYKFMNFGRKSILPGETLIDLVFQPEIKQELFRLSGWSFSRTLDPAHLAILTSRELILIRDDNSPGGLNGVRYGGIWTYVPLNKIDSAALAEKAPDLLALSLHLPQGDRLEVLFAGSNRDEVERFAGQMGERARKLQASWQVGDF